MPGACGAVSLPAGTDVAQFCGLGLAGDRAWNRNGHDWCEAIYLYTWESEITPGRAGGFIV